MRVAVLTAILSLSPQPQGEFFSLFEITDKGSSWMGPIAVGLIQQATGSIRYGIFYVLVMLTLPLVLLWGVDEEEGMREAVLHAAVNRAEDKQDLGQLDSPIRGGASDSSTPTPSVVNGLLVGQKKAQPATIELRGMGHG